MFERNYYSLVAGLKEYALEADNKGFDAREIIETIRCELSSAIAVPWSCFTAAATLPT